MLEYGRIIIKACYPTIIVVCVYWQDTELWKFGEECRLLKTRNAVKSENFFQPAFNSVIFLKVTQVYLKHKFTYKQTKKTRETMMRSFGITLFLASLKILQLQIKYSKIMWFTLEKVAKTCHKYAKLVFKPSNLKDWLIIII